MTEAFRQYLETERQYSTHTVTAYTQDVKECIQYIFDAFNLDLNTTRHYDAITHRMLRSWMADMIQQKISKRSVARKIASLNAFYRFLLKTGAATQNPARRVAIPKAEKKLPVFLKQEETQRLFAPEMFTDDFIGLRDRCILEVLYGCGIRRAEVVQLQFRNIKFQENVLKVLGKGNKERIIPFGAPVKDAFMKYIQTCEEQGFDYSTHFLLNDKGNKLNPRFVHTIVNRYISNVSNIQKKSPHVLRHSFATHLLDEGADLNAIKEMLGHTSLAATQVYVHNSIAKLKKAYQQAHPKA